MRLVDLLGPQELEKFGSRHEELAAQCSASLEFAALNEPVHAEIIDAKQVGSFLHRIGQAFGLGRLLYRFDGIH